MHWEPAVSGSQQAVGRRGGIPPRICTHDDEAGAGMSPKTENLTHIYQNTNVQ